MLRFVIGMVADFEETNIDISTARKSLDDTQAIIHIEKITDEELEAIRYNSNFQFTSKSEEVLQEEGWKIAAEEGV